MSNAETTFTRERDQQPVVTRTPQRVISKNNLRKRKREHIAAFQFKGDAYGEHKYALSKDSQRSIYDAVLDLLMEVETDVDPMHLAGRAYHVTRDIVDEFEAREQRPLDAIPDDIPNGATGEHVYLEACERLEARLLHDVTRSIRSHVLRLI